jgi:hypothetical protein
MRDVAAEDKLAVHIKINWLLKAHFSEKTSCEGCVLRFLASVIKCINTWLNELCNIWKIAMTEQRKQEIITFKVDEALRQAMKGVQNRSEFIRSAILAALDSACPLCKGSGILTPDQRKHWQSFAESHPLRECDDCHAMHLVCSAEPK